MAELLQRKGRAAVFAQAEADIRATVERVAEPLLATTPELTRSVGDRGAQMLRDVVWPFVRNPEVGQAQLSAVLAQSEEARRWSGRLEISLMHMKQLETELAAALRPKRWRALLLLAIGLAVPIMGALTIGLLMFGPTLKFLVVPLFADAVKDAAGLLGNLGDALGVELAVAPMVKSLLAPAAIVRFAVVLAAALAIVVVLVPDVAMLFGRFRSSAARIALLVSKTLFAVAFLAIRAPDLRRIRLPAIAGSFFELCIIGISYAVVTVVGRHLDEIRSQARARHTAEAMLHSESVHQMRVAQRLSELRAALDDDRNEGLGAYVDGSSLLAEAEQRGRTIAELELLATLARNLRTIQEAESRLQPELAAALEAIRPAPLLN